MSDSRSMNGGIRGEPPVQRAVSSAPPRARKAIGPRSVPTVHRSYVVEIAAEESGGEGFTARVRPVERAAEAAEHEGFRFSDSVLDTVATLLIELAREEDEGG